MSVGSLCNHNVATIAASAGIVEAAARMREAHVGDLVVTELRNGVSVPIGMVTDRDLVLEVLAQGTDPAMLKVSDVMNADLVTVQEDNGLEYALREMRRKGFRRVPVVSRKNALVGILSIDDVIEHLARLTGYVADAYRVEQQTESRLRS